ncbi:ATP-binding protein [Methanosarcina mazei]|jgi:DNA repair exonuclease SbcCD ATPase subunit|uniref:DNA double-strand break repair Rad50 ATPase n=2 Tax=Methanosarcina mazei TaxID=2209 RepID=A0A0E3RRL6_METMZ|nr:ATP-binding protein [Methanosarcina mazei]AKB69501.1 DNA double-strand break repair Rad50 ATPase [Methanosarcina mazei LYC]MDY0143824.1 AAA family ATPase [Bacteroidales bacterium]
MNKFRIDEFKITKFNSRRYLGVGLTKLDNNILIYGEHKSGKSTTLDALSYAIFGIKGSSRSINNRAETYIKISNDELELTLDRKAGNNHRLTIKNLTDGSIETITEIESINCKLIDLFNLPSEDCLEFKTKLLYQDQESSLKKYDSKKLWRIISFYTSLSSKNEEIEKLRNEIKSKVEEREYSFIEKKELESNLNEKRSVIYSSKNYIEHLDQLISSYDNGSIKQVFDVKKTSIELWKDIRSLQGKNISLQQELNKASRSKLDLEKFHEETLINLIKEVISVLICPVCGKRANLSKIEYKYNAKKCPYCGDESYDKELYDNIAQRIQLSNDELPKLNEKIKGIYEERKKNYETLNEFKNKLNDLDLILNPEIVRSTEDFESFEDDKFKNFIETQREKLNKFQNDFKEIETDIKELTNQIEIKNNEIIKITTDIKSLEENISTLEKELEEKSSKKFLELVNYYYGKIMGYKKQPIILENGKLFFKTRFRNKYEEIDDISASKEIGESEKKCLDTSLLFTFIDLNNEYNSSLIDFVILDDPADGLYDDVSLPVDAQHKTNLLNLIKEKCVNNDTQFLILTADKTYNEILELPTTSIKFNTDLYRFDSQ